MKKITLVAMLVFAVAQMSMASTEEERYLAYFESCLMELQAGGIFNGSIYESNPGADSWIEGRKLSFTESFVGGVARAKLNCSVGWYRASASWENTDREELFHSQSMDATYLNAGFQTLPFMMVVNQNRTIRFQILGALPSDSDEVWFNGSLAWRDGNFWRTSVYKPWNIIDTTVEIIWAGHGGWCIQMNQDSFGGVIGLDIGDMDGNLLAPTRLKAVSFLADSCLEDGFINYNRRYYNTGLGCEVLEFTSAFAGEIAEFTLFLNGVYDKLSGERVNYYTVTLNVVTGTFFIPLGDIWIMPQTQVRIYMTDPRTGDYVWKDIYASDIWYDNSSTDGGGFGK